MGSRFLRQALLIGAALTAFACKGYKQIPEETLVDIFTDMYELNAYIDRHPVRENRDSIDLYEPVLAAYGYTTEDFTRTLTEATRRKSFRLTDIIDASVAKMEQERDAIDRELRIVERIDSTALAYSTRELYRDSLITIRSLADSAAMRVEVPLDELSGRIGIDYYYTLDSLDRNDDLQNRHALLSATGKSRGSAVQRLRKGPRTAYSTSLPCSREAVRLEITFGNYPERPKRMHLTIDSLVVTYVPPLSEAYEEFSHTYRYRLMIDDREYNTFYYDEENSRPLRFPSPLLPPECDSLMER